ncbi:hypothetical protein LIT63_10195 [Flavobacterium psychrophilum]|uniref:hypothetical protein n=1 Tax=Flavobacterium psychrophilum TaxID=96345 RepID=UPI001D0808A8|nr:hypothetical protein [Flavobacterium psychrophilum]MCB6000070.1 hypothetical protein [Flavobacterium psychrophilum]MCB6014959.1 hypothetical protein [Flavobacterium psychrophilum]MCB6022332.1 hypothetical protein [Flavobacterium psychrophilum]MCB6032219.1 hypothetical protein [Flavobacterium psychrophilum]MCB6037394.1 hypothetical protein [Flavobacterium psychrophilum]
MNVFSKRLDKFKSFYNNPNPFKNKADDFVFRFFGVSLIFVILRIIIDYFSKEYVIKGMYEYVALGIVTFSIILACFFSLILPARFFSLILKNIFVKSQIKSLEPKINEREELDLESMTDEEKFISFFNEGLFEEFKTKAIENKILDENLKWIFDDNTKYPTYFYHYLVEKRFINKGKREFTIKAYAELTSKIFDIKVDHTMYSKTVFKPSFDKNEKNRITADIDYQPLLIFEE